MSRRVRLGIGAVMACVWGGWLGGYLWAGGYFNPLGQPFAGDHLAFATAARFVLTGRQADLYDFDAVAAYQADQFPPGVWRAALVFRNPPFYALLYLPTARMPVFGSAAAWTVVSLAALLLTLRWLDPAGRRAALPWCLTFFPVFAVISYGQNTLLSAAVFAGCYRLLANGRPFAAGLAAGLLWYKPTLTLGLLVWWGSRPRRHRRELAGLLAGGALLTVGSYPLLPEAWRAFAGTLGANVRFRDFELWKAHGVRDFAAMLLPGAALAPARLALTLGLMAAGVAWFRRLSGPPSPKWRGGRQNSPIRRRRRPNALAVAPRHALRVGLARRPRRAAVARPAGVAPRLRPDVSARLAGVLAHHRPRRRRRPGRARAVRVGIVRLGAVDGPGGRLGGVACRAAP